MNAQNSAFDPIEPQVQRPSGNNTGLVIGLVAALVAVPMMLVCAGVLVALLLPAVQAAREAARRMQCSNNLKQVALAMHNYHETYKTFPPAYTVDGRGKPLHSWRTLLLPFMEQKGLYDQIDQSKPWDDPVNLPFTKVAIAVYTCPSTNLPPSSTTYVVVNDRSGIFSGAQACTLGQVTDGTSNTLLVTETDEANAVNWMSPQDIDLPTFLDPTGVRHAHPGGTQMSLADGSVQFLSEQVDGTTRAAMVSKAAGD